MFKKFLAGATAVAATAGLLAVAAPNAQALSKPDSIVSALVARSDNNPGDSPTDRRWWDNDILIAAADALGLVPTLQGFDGTVFAPNDYAFRVLVADLTDQRVRNVSEAEALETLVAIAGEADLNGTGISGAAALTETVKYHATAEQIPNLRLRNRDSAPVDTITDLPASLSDGQFDIRGRWWSIRLADDDTDDRDPRYVGRTIEAENGGTVHVIDRVLRPLDLQILFPAD
jgi:uncharacterized surface protein with fasciclin (FAS1) repeats